MRFDLKSTVIGLALMGGVAVVTPAKSADFGGSRSNYSTPTLATNWGGFYGGLHVGYGTGHARNANLGGFLGGIHAGMNFQTGQAVFGVEGDLNYSGVDYHGFADAFRQKWSGSLRGRVGYAYDRFMPFITAGMDFNNAVMKSGGAKDSQTHVGLVLGAGVEMMLTDKISLTGQYLYHRDGGKTYAVLPVARNTTMTTNEFRIGVNYRF